ncbi:MAG: hypothetical protein ABW184_04980 [Sphingobium sp.]
MQNPRPRPATPAIALLACAAFMWLGQRPTDWSLKISIAHVDLAFTSQGHDVRFWTIVSDFGQQALSILASLAA